MKIKFLDSVAGARFAYRKNQVADLRVDLARAFVKAGQAVIVPDDEPEVVREQPVELAVATPAEAAVTRGGRGRKRSIRNLGGLLQG